MDDSKLYTQGEYAGPLTQRAMDYNGHTVVGVQISDPAPDGSCFFITLDDHMQVSIAPVLANSIREYDPHEPPPDPEIDAADLAATRKNLEWLLQLQVEHGISSIGDLRACALTMSDLADVIELQDRAQAAQAPGQALDGDSSADVPSAERGGNTSTAEVSSAPLADDKAKQRGDWPKIRQYVSMTDEDVSGNTGSVCQTPICGHTVFNDLGQPVGWVDIDLTGGTVFDEPIDPDYAEDVR